MLDTYQSIFNKVTLRCPSVSSLLARDWTSHAFRQIAERRRWSWKVKYGQFILPALYNTGSVTVTLNSTTVTGSGTAWTSAMVGRQFRTAVPNPIYTIAQVNSGTSLELDLPWGAATASAQNYSIYAAYLTPPDDFHSLISVWDPNYNWQLWLNVHQSEINAIDAQRSNTGPSSYLVSCRDYTTSYNGAVDAVLQVLGSGPDPASASLNGLGYTGQNNAIFTVEVTTGGITGTAIFRWKKNDGSYTSNITTDSVVQDLSDGVQVYWPTGNTYVQGDIWVIRCTASLSSGLPRYEFWPHKQAAYVYPFLYESRPLDLEDAGAVLPRYIRGDVLLEMVMANVANWPGPSQDKPNPYFNFNVGKRHDLRAEQMIAELERQDDEVMEQDAMYQKALAMKYAPWPLGDANWLQSHAI